MGRRRTTVPTAENNPERFTFRLTQKGRHEIRAALQRPGRDIKISNAKWKQLGIACATYIAMETSDRAAPRFEDVSTHLTKLIKAFDRLRNLLDEPDESEALAKIHAIRAFVREFCAPVVAKVELRLGENDNRSRASRSTTIENFNPGQLVTNVPNDTPRTLDATELRRLCAFAAQAAKEAIKENHLRAEREFRGSLANFIGRLEEWTLEIGVPPTARKDEHQIPSAFVRFVKAVFSEIPKEWRPKFNSNHAIATRISEARKIRRSFGSNTA